MRTVNKKDTTYNLQKDRIDLIKPYVHKSKCGRKGRLTKYNHEKYIINLKSLTD